MLDFPRPRRARLALDLAPLVDVVFLLLVFFILTSSFLPPALPLELPAAANESQAPPDPVVVSLDAGGVIAVNGRVVAAGDFPAAIRSALQEREHAPVHFRGDRAAPYGSFLRLMDEARSAGAKSLHLIHDPAK